MINSFKQKQIYDAMKWEVPNFAHIPLIHSEQGKKLSKRDNASTLEDYIKIGVISDAGFGGDLLGFGIRLDDGFDARATRGGGRTRHHPTVRVILFTRRRSDSVVIVQ